MILAAGSILLILLNSTWFSATAIIGQAYPVWHIDQSVSAWVSIGTQWGFAVGAILVSLSGISDIIPDRLLILVSSVGAAVANFSLLHVGSPAGAIAARVVTGFFVAGIYPPWIKLISTWYKDRRGLAVGILVGALNIGEGLPFFINVLGNLNWHVVVMSTSIATISGGIATWILVVEGPYPFSQGKLDVRQIVRVLRTRSAMLSTAGYVGHMWELYAALAWFFPFTEAVMPSHGIGSPKAASLVTFAVFVAGGIATWTCGGIGDRFGREEVAIAMMLLSACCCLLIGPASSLPQWAFIAMAIIWGYAVIGDSVQFSALITEYAPGDCVGTALTLQMAAGFFLSGATIWLVPVIRSFVGWQMTFAFLAIGPLAGIIAMRRSIRERRHVPSAPPATQVRVL